MAKIIIEAQKQKFLFKLKAGNGKELLFSNPLNTKDDCFEAIDKTKRMVKERRNFKLMKTAGLEPYFVLEDGHIEIRSRVYASHANLIEAVPHIQRNIEKAAIIDLT